MADAYAPDLGVGTARQQALGGSKGVVGDLEGPAVHVESHDPPAVARLDLRAHTLLVQIATTAGVLFFAVTGLAYRHCSFPIRRVGNPRNRIVHQPGGRATRPIRPRAGVADRPGPAMARHSGRPPAVRDLGERFRLMTRSRGHSAPSIVESEDGYLLQSHLADPGLSGRGRPDHGRLADHGRP
jgi:hypothetical protein